MKTSRLMTLALAGIVMCGFGITTAQASATSFTLVDGNSSAFVDLAGNGMTNWTVDGIDNLFQQWFWYRVGTTGGEASLDTLSLGTHGATDTNFDGDFDTLFATFNGSGFDIEITWSLIGAAAGTSLSDIAEQISITNTGSQALDFHFFQYSDFDLNGELDQDTVVSNSSPWNTWRQTNPNGLQLSETVVSPQPSHFEAGEFPDTVTDLNDGSPTTLSDFAGPLGPLDATWALQWDFNLDVGGSFLISKDKSMQRVPAPGAALLAVMGMGMIGRIRRRNA